jgi:hypothetical protein
MLYQLQAKSEKEFVRLQALPKILPGAAVASKQVANMLGIATCKNKNALQSADRAR